MRKFLIVAFIATFFFSYAFFGPGRGLGSIASAIGGAILLTFVGWQLAEALSPRWGAVALSVIFVIVWIGR